MLEFRFPPKLSLKRIARIKNPSKKLFHLFSYYSESEAYNTNKNNLGGFIDMIEGLEYHFKRHCMFEKKARLNKPYNKAKHEAVSYINRMGQIYKAFISPWFRNYINQENAQNIIPTICALEPIRNKFTAHRQQDDPRNDDCDSLGIQHFGLIPSIVGKIQSSDKSNLLTPYVIDPKSNLSYDFPTKQRLFKDKKYPAVEGIEYIGKNNNVIIFTPTINHPVILKEIFLLLEKFLLS